MKQSGTQRRNLLKAALLVSTSLPGLAVADCLLGNKNPNFICSSYEFNLPVNISTTESVSLTVMGGNVGIGTTNPLAKLDLYYLLPSNTDSEMFIGSQSKVIANASTSYSGQVIGSAGKVGTGSAQSGDVNSMYGTTGDVVHAGTGTINYATGLNSGIYNQFSGTITTATGLNIAAPSNTGGGSIGTFYGIYLSTPTAATTNYSIYSQGGKNYFGGDTQVAGTLKATTICDQNGNNCKVVADGWSSGGGSGTITSVTAGTGLTGGTITTTGTLAVDVGTTANKIVQLNESAELPAVNGSNLTNVNAVSLNGTGVSTSGNASGQVLGYNGTSWTNRTLTVSDVAGLTTNLGSKLDAANMPASCAANQTLTFTSPTGMWACSNIVVTPSVFGTQTQGQVLAAPSSGNGVPTFRTIASTDLPSDIVAGTWGNSGGNIFKITGNVGIGTVVPGQKLTVAGIIETTSGGIKFPDGTIQTTAAGAGIGDAPDSFSIYKTSNQSISTSETIIDWQAKKWDSSSAFNLATDRFQPTVAGKYVFSLTTYAGSMTGTKYLEPVITKNGSIVAIGVDWATGDDTTAFVTVIVDMNGTTDYVDFRVYAGGASTLRYNYTQATGYRLSTSGSTSSAPPIAEITTSSLTSLNSTSTWTKLPFELTAMNFGFNIDGLTQKIFATTPGYYRYTLQTTAFLTGSTSYQYTMAFFRNDFPVRTATTTLTSAATTQTLSLTGIVYLNGTTDYIYAQGKGQNTTVYSGEDQTALTLELIRN